AFWLWLSWGSRPRLYAAACFAGSAINLTALLSTHFRDRTLAAKNKLKQYYEKLGFVEMKSTPFMFRSMAWALPSIEQLRSEQTAN
ncbi:MAG: hypothetical protein LC770_06800, partial [Acidobacteria bacterium]|nr:hypothetical protein [Acidobacteriota bacterium]